MKSAFTYRQIAMSTSLYTQDWNYINASIVISASTTHQSASNMKFYTME